MREPLSQSDIIKGLKIAHEKIGNGLVAESQTEEMLALRAISHILKTYTVVPCVEHGDKIIVDNTLFTVRIDNDNDNLVHLYSEG